MNILPSPYKISERDGVLRFGRKAVLTIGETFAMDLKLYQELWSKFTYGLSELVINKVSHGAGVAVLAENASDLPKPVGTEFEYSIKSCGERAVLEYNDGGGLVHSLSTLLQIIEPENIENAEFKIHGCEIFDKPAMEFRGIHICVFPETKLYFLEKTVRLASFLKFSHIILEFWGTLKLDAMKELAWPEAYTKDEIRPIIEQARAMGTDIIPMFNHLGHASASRVRFGKHVVLDQNPRLQELFEPDGWTWCISNPKTLSLLKNIREEQIDFFGNCGYYHIGCDEAYSFCSCRVCSKKDRGKFYADYLNMLSDELSEKGIRAIMWGDTLLAKEDFPSPYIGTSDETTKMHEAIDKIDKNIIINDWQYNISDEEPRTSIYLKEKGFDVLLSPFFEYKNISNVTAHAKKYFGAMGTTWHKLNDNFLMLPQTAQVAWAGEDYYDQLVLLTNTASVLRKLSDENRGYTGSGFNEVEVMYGIL